MESKIVLDELVVNKDRRFGSVLKYYPVMIDSEPGLFTENELNVAKERAARNPEDIPEDQTFWEHFFK